MEWYRQAFESDYLTIYARRDQREASRQVGFVEKELRLTKGARVLDLACGPGRHAIELSRRGYDTFCLDLSSAMLSRARLAADRDGLALHLIRSDMRYLPFKGRFDAVLSFFTSFGYFCADEENRRVLQQIAAALRPTGKFLIDTFNGDHVVQELTPFDEELRDGSIIRQWRWYNPASRRVEKRIVIKRGKVVRRIQESVRSYTRSELLDLLLSVGLGASRVYGDFDGSAWTPASPRIIVIGSRQTRAGGGLEA